MTVSSLERFVHEVQATWGPLSTQLVEACQASLGGLARSPATEPWLAALHRTPPEDTELYRDPRHGFLLLTHAERTGRYRVPHDHGRGWVIYAVQSGEMEMSSYGLVGNRLVRRDTYVVRAGECRVYLPGDIHDTRCVSDQVLMLRLTSCDLKQEDRLGHMTRYAAP